MQDVFLLLQKKTPALNSEAGVINVSPETMGLGQLWRHYERAVLMGATLGSHDVPSGTSDVDPLRQRVKSVATSASAPWTRFRILLERSNVNAIISQYLEAFP